MHVLLKPLPCRAMGDGSMVKQEASLTHHAPVGQVLPETKPITNAAAEQVALISKPVPSAPVAKPGQSPALTLANSAEPLAQAEPDSLATLPGQAAQAGMTAPETQGHAPEPAQAGDVQTLTAQVEQDADPTQAPTVPPENLGEALLKVVEERAMRAEKGVVRSMAAQYGMEETQLAELLKQERAVQERELPSAAQEQISAMQARYGEKLLVAEVKAIGAELGLIDPEAALRLMDAGSITVTEQGEVQGARESLQALRQAKPYLFMHTGAWAQRLDGGGLAPLTGVEEAFYRKNPALRGLNPKG